MNQGLAKILKATSFAFIFASSGYKVQVYKKRALVLIINNFKYLVYTN